MISLLIPNEILCIIFLLLDAKTLIVAVPQVCKLWRGRCQELSGVHLNFRWWGKVPLEVFAGFRQTPFMDLMMSVGHEGDAARERVWNSGMCELFPGTTSVTMMDSLCRQEVDAHLLALADKCHKCHKCRGLTHVDFSWCINLTDAAVVGLADKCLPRTYARLIFWQLARDGSNFFYRCRTASKLRVRFLGQHEAARLRSTPLLKKRKMIIPEYKQNEGTE